MCLADSEDPDETILEGEPAIPQRIENDAGVAMVI